MPGVCDEIRERCRWVAERAAHVRIDPERLPDYARELSLSERGRVGSDPAHHALDDPEGTAAFVISLDAINFGSGWFPTIRKRPGMSGYHTIATAWREHVEAHGAPTAEALTALTRAEVCRIFDQVDDEDDPATELMELFTSALNDLGAFVLEEADGSFLAVVEGAGGSAERLVTILDRMPFFHDVAEYHGVDVPLYKRAQITAMDLHLAFGGEGPGRFDDIARLTMFPDNLVPHVLRIDGVLAFDDDLVHRIDAEELIAPGTDEEIEIRACGVHAVELLRDELERQGHHITSGELDTILWTMGGDPRYKARPRHRTRTVSY
ncbi:queuosine salvage family protein [Actinomarinicola tropica]|uniref:queuosine salvage family protein n=1 Tax=Actinomarinicola tropica TaxID=2789776 RepID=UPI001E63C3F8|nr:queuosine salvage family protein [Actinomarinicola tropica]